MLSHFKRRLGALAAVAVLAAIVPTVTSTPTVSAAPATVAITALTVGSPAVYKACPTGSASAAGFTDTTSTAVDCLKMFGITTGTTATTYSPDDSVTRWAMALFLTRAAGPAGITLGTGADQGFTDITGKSAEIQTAINQIKQLGITTGKTATTFAPDDNVTREEMALFIERFLTNSIAGPGGQSDADGAVTAAATTYVTSDCGGTTACTGKYNYTDVDAGSVTVEGANAIKELFDMGIHDGVSATTFNPGSDMTRAAMATFLELALNHTNARPAGLWLQASAYTNAGAHTPTLSATDRSATFAAIAGTPVDVFYWTTSTTEGNAAFLATGLCDDSVATGASITKCYIDTGEPQTNTNGNVVPTAVQTDPYLTVYQGSDVYYAWTAAAATTYDDDLHGETAAADDHSSITVAATAAATDIRCTMDTPANAQVTSDHNHKMKAGASVTVSCQVKDGATATAGNVAKAAQYVQLNQSREFNLDSTGSQTGNTILVNETLSATDATGAVSFTIAGPVDADGTGVSGYNDDWIDTITVTCVAVSGSLTTCNNAGTVANYSGYMTDGGAALTFILTYDDDAAAAATSALTSTATSGLAATTGVTRTYTATVYDQYGDTVAANAGTFSSASALPKSALCTVASPVVCTIAAHGLAVGDDLHVVGRGSLRASNGVTDLIDNAAAAGTKPTLGSHYAVGTVPSVDTFTLKAILADGTTGTALNGQLIDNVTDGVASVAATPTELMATSTAIAARTTTTDGTASYSWTDTEGTSGRDLITWTPTTASVKTKTYFRLATAASFLETGNDDSTVDAGETIGKLVEWDTTNNDYIVQVSTNTAATDQTLTYYQYNYDSNDQFGHTGTVAAPGGTATTEALFEYYVGLANTASVGLGAYGDIQGVQSYAALSTGTSQHWDG